MKRKYSSSFCVHASHATPTTPITVTILVVDARPRSFTARRPSPSSASRKLHSSLALWIQSIPLQDPPAPQTIKIIGCRNKHRGRGAAASFAQTSPKRNSNHQRRRHKQASDQQGRANANCDPMASPTRSEQEQRPLLPSNHPSHHEPEPDDHSEAPTLKRRTARFLNSKAGHYSILALVSLDIAGIFTAFVLQLFTCEGHIAPESSARAERALEILSLLFSCLFVLELAASVWVFGWAYFRSRFHCFDAVVILVGFVVDVLLKGVLEEIGSLVVIMRLWRVFKIIEELSAGAEEQMSILQRQIVTLRKENEALSNEVRELKMR